MACTATGSKAEAAGRPSEQSLLLNISGEIRLKIYGHAVEPRAVFNHTRRDYIMQRMAYRHGQHGTAGIYLPRRDWKPRPLWHPEHGWCGQDEDTSDESGTLHDNSEDSWDEDASRFVEGPQVMPTLGYQVSTYSPLLLVNKQLSIEVSGWLRRSGLQRSVHATIRQCVFGDTLVPSRDPGFIPVVGHSKLVLSLTADYSISFLQRMPRDVRRHLHSVILVGETTQWNDGPTRLAWSKKKTERHAAYTLALRNLLPNLRDVGIYIPRSGLERDTFCPYAPVELADMLSEGLIDTVRLLYRESCDAGTLETDTTLEAVQATDCLACGRRQSEMECELLKRCGRCLKAWYCSPSCQRTDWRSHRAWCREADASDKKRPARDPRLPQFEAIIEHAQEQSERALAYTVVSPHDKWVGFKTAIALRRKSDC